MNVPKWTRKYGVCQGKCQNFPSMGILRNFSWSWWRLCRMLCCFAHSPTCLHPFSVYRTLFFFCIFLLFHLSPGVIWYFAFPLSFYLSVLPQRWGRPWGKLQSWRVQIFKRSSQWIISNIVLKSKGHFRPEDRKKSVIRKESLPSTLSLICELCS